MSGTKKRDMEIIYNLVWKNGTERSILGMCDVSGASLSWDNFKSYLMKNSGSTCSDVKVSYIDVDGKEVHIDSSANFQLAMYSFRKRARSGDVITLYLERNKKKDHSKFWFNEDLFTPKESSDEDVPEWFIKYMKKFKQDMIEEVTSAVLRAAQKGFNSSQHTSRRQKSSDWFKKSKNPLLQEYQEFRKMSENKVDRLDHRIIKKMMMKMSSDSDVGRGPSQGRLLGAKPSYTQVMMNAKPVNSQEPTVVHLFGGGVYLQAWKVLNCGKLPWDNNTELRLAWGSECLKPFESSVACPPLKPGEQGVVSVLLNVPVTPGKYECYWHFYQQNCRFGHWLGCEVIVDDSPIKHAASKKPKLSKTEAGEPASDVPSPPKMSPSTNNLEDVPKTEDVTADLIPKIESVKLEQSAEVPLSIQIANNIVTSDSDNISILSLSGNSSDTSVGHERGYIFVNENDASTPINKEENAGVVETAGVEQKCNNDEGITDEAALDAAECDYMYVQKEKHPFFYEEQNAIVQEGTNQESNSNEHVKVEESDASEYAYIYYQGEKYPFHKKFLSGEYFSKAEKVESMTKSEGKKRTESGSDTKSIESTGTRLFVFPQHSPGFEVVYPTCDEIDSFNKSVDDNMAASFISVDDGSLNSTQLPGISNNKSSNPTDSGMCGSMNSIYNNAGSHGSECGAANMQNSTFLDRSAYQPKFEECNNCFVQDFTTPCPYQVNEHILAGCSPQGCNVNFASTPIDLSKSTSSHTLYDSVPPNTESVSATPPTAHSAESTSGEYTQVPRPNPRNGRPDNLITGAAILASSAMSTARSMMNMVIQNGGGKWVNGHWIVENPNTKREDGLRLLAEMGFLNRDLNATLMARFNDDVHRVISELIQ